jgi:hypothetical protein
MYVNKLFGTYEMEDETRSKLQVAAWFKAQSANVIHKKPFEPKKSERPLTAISAVVLNIKKTANEREVFSEMIR